ncbi:hypothetical protein X975_08690, partial [Stegodyphus mimosarum]
MWIQAASSRMILLPIWWPSPLCRRPLEMTTTTTSQNHN